MQRLPPDVLQYVILPFLQSPENRQDIQDALQSPVPLMNLKSAAESIENIAALRATCREWKELVDRTCRYDYHEAKSAVAQQYHNVWVDHQYHKCDMKEVHVSIINTIPRIPPSYVSDGCFACGKALPHCWPILHTQMWPNSAEMSKERKRNIFRKRWKNLLANHSQWLPVGCCSTICYESFYAPILTLFAERNAEIYIHECGMCHNGITPSAVLEVMKFKRKDSVRPYFCNRCIRI